MYKKGGLERFLLKNMFEKSLFTDLSLVFLHPAFPFSMRFNVHRAIVSQSPFLYKLLKNMEQIPSEQQDHGQGMTSLTINLATAWQNCGFHLAPFDHIIRRQWQKTPSQRSSSSNPLLTSHIRFVLQWFYCIDKEHLLNSIQDCDTLCILSVAILMDVHDLAQACVDRYINEQLSLDSIMRDLETICQLPKSSRSYLHLRDATLLLLFRLGPTHPARLAMLPVDYMADVLSADPLFITNEFERYSLLKSVLLAFMHSVGTISWTENGPVDQNDKRLSGFIKPRAATILKKGDGVLSANDVRSRKRKRIPSEDFTMLDQETPSVKLSRLSFTALVPFEKLVADASSGGVLDKATVLSYLLKTTVNYSNMTFDQLTRVRHDGIVDEGIVFRALWQREALERILYPTTLNEDQQYTQERYLIENDEMRDIQRDEGDDGEHLDRSAALDEYFDVDASEKQERRRRLLLGTPKFRFCTSVFITRPNQENGWECELKQRKKSTQEPDEFASVFDDDDEDDSDGSLWVASDHDANSQDFSIKQKTKEIVKDLGIADRAMNDEEAVEYKTYTQTFYSESEIILGVAYRLQVEAQVIPRYLLQIQDREDDEKEQESIFMRYNTNHQDDVLVCRFELQRDMRTIEIPIIKKEKKSKSDSSSQQQDEEKNVSEKREIITPPSSSQSMPKKAKIHYWIYCLNRHEGVLENDKVDPEDRMLVPVTEQEEIGGDGEMGPGYVGQVLIDANLKRGVSIDATVALEIFGLPKV
ncbi:hypothetical protein K501DRAFT_284809 [Backusella circina FSU 941]|nr:hypothetical protein K501DRAFT_284809 [Backusella circina FSU 941]